MIKKYENGYSYEEIETAFEKLCNETRKKETIIDNNSELVDSLVGIMNYKNGILARLNLGYDKSKYIRQEILEKWQKQSSSEDIKNSFYTLCEIKPSELANKLGI